MKTLILTARGDLCSDILAPYFQSEVVRLDLDFLHHDGFRWTPKGLMLSGRGISWCEVSALYWRKPGDPICHDMPQLERFELQQRLHVFRSLSALARSLGIWQLVDPLHEYKIPKPLQLEQAGDLFQTPSWEICTGCRTQISLPLVSKAFAPVPVKGDRMLVTTKIDEPDKLDPRFTWFLQPAVPAKLDATVVFCCGETWGFALERPRDSSWIDWRLVMDNHREAAWRRIEVPEEISQSIHTFMHRLGLHYGRLDFLVDESDTWWFLEVNPNGQFGWLDPHNTNGVLATIAKFAERDPNAAS